MKLTTKQITWAAVLLAVSIISQFFKNTSVFITGPVINACIILAVLSAGLSCGIILSAITPVTSYFITGSPIMSAIPAIIPCVMIGNMLIAFSVSLLKSRIKNKLSLPIALAAGSVMKALFMGISISLILIPSFLPEQMQHNMSAFQTTFSIVQLITALIGSIYAYIIWIPLKTQGGD